MFGSRELRPQTEVNSVTFYVLPARPPALFPLGAVKYGISKFVVDVIVSVA